jgi:hypothetical protein
MIDHRRDDQRAAAQQHQHQHDRQSTKGKREGGGAHDRRHAHAGKKRETARKGNLKRRKTRGARRVSTSPSP